MESKRKSVMRKLAVSVNCQRLTFILDNFVRFFRSVSIFIYCSFFLSYVVRKVEKIASSADE